MHTPVRLRVLRSGSSGNAFYVEAGGTAVLVDAGVAADALQRDLAALPGARVPSAILLTHEHDDHARGAAALARTLGIPVFANDGTMGSRAPVLTGAPLERFVTGWPFRVGALTIEGFPVPHDAVEPVGFALSSDGVQVVVVTDLGEATDEVLARAAGANVVLVEANYDLALLAVSPYPWFLKNRILSPTGHLSNDAASRVAVQAAAGRAQAIVLVHLSDINNLTSLARDTVQGALAHEGLTRARIETVPANGQSPLWDF